MSFRQLLAGEYIEVGVLVWTGECLLDLADGDTPLSEWYGVMKWTGGLE